MLERIKEIFGSEGLKLSDEQARKFEVYLKELLKWNKVHNLTSITEPEEIIRRHFVESVSLSRCFRKAGLNWRGKSFADVGSGAGFPGIPLKIYLKDLELYLIEAVGKTCSFLEYLKIKLNEDYEVICERAERVSERFDVVVARALGSFDEVHGLLEELSRKYVFVMKGRSIREEWVRELGYRVYKLGLSFAPESYVLWKVKS